MARQVGVWMSRGKAVIVRLDHGEESVTEMTSEVEAKHRSTGGLRAGRPYWHRSVNPARRYEARREVEEARFYEELAKALGPYNSLWVFGPGEGKREFVDYLAAHGHSSKSIDELDAASARISLRQITAQVKRHFGQQAPRKERRLAGMPVAK